MTSFILLDWQAWRIDFPLYDLAYMMTLIWHPDQRQTMEIKLLNCYYNCLLQNGITNYSWNECWCGYRVSAIMILQVPFIFFGYKLSQDVWWPAMEKSYMAFQDLQCIELLDGGTPARERV